MRPEKAIFICQACGYESAKWMGKCPACEGWNSFVEEIRREPGPSGAGRSSGRGGARAVGACEGGGVARAGRHASPGPVPVGGIEITPEDRVPTGIAEFDRVLGGGVVAGSVVLIGGDPGIGKSTLLLQISENVARRRGPVLYVTGEESVRQVGLRATRLGAGADSLMVLAETDVWAIEDRIASMRPSLVVIDSIQTMADPGLESSPGSVGQVRECAGRLARQAKDLGAPVFLVGHVTKSGSIAGPKVLEHMVDTVLYFEGESHHTHRLIRAVKNRYGSTDEVGIFTMTDRGLEEVQNPSEMLLSERPGGAAGSVVAASIEGSRPLLVEIQALVARSVTGTPRRTTTGVDYNRTAIIVAVLDRRVGLGIGAEDIYVNVAGGLSIAEPAADLAIAAAIASSFRGVPAAPSTVVFGEVGLAGELRAVNHAELRVAEAERLGFHQCVLPKHNLKSMTRRARPGVRADAAVRIIGAATVGEALDAALLGVDR
ncbi:MAG: DNA repair protein RadA [Clostridia bacterium]|nr:DNA repair protein RadA [Clostridia bacterium]